MTKAVSFVVETHPPVSHFSFLVLDSQVEASETCLGPSLFQEEQQFRIYSEPDCRLRGSCSASRAPIWSALGSKQVLGSRTDQLFRIKPCPHQLFINHVTGSAGSSSPSLSLCRGQPRLHSHFSEACPLLLGIND